jgi:hypothetical protein
MPSPDTSSVIPQTHPASWLYRAWWRLRGSEARLGAFQRGVNQLTRQMQREDEGYPELLGRMQALLRQGVSLRGRGLWEQAEMTDEERLARTLGWTLDSAIEHGVTADGVNLLLQAGADANARENNNYSDTPLTRALRHGRVDLVNVLLDHGANPALADSCDESAWAMAIKGYHRVAPGQENPEDLRKKALWKGVLDTLFERANPAAQSVGSRDRLASPVWWDAVEQVDVELLRRFHAYGVDFRTHDRYGHSPLHALMEADVTWSSVAAEERERAHSARRVACARWLCETAGVSALMTDRQGCTALGRAVWEGDVDVARYLMEQGDVPGPGTLFQPHQEQPALTLPEILVQRHEFEDPIVQWLLPLLGDECWMWRNPQGMTALDCVEAVIERGVDHEVQRMGGWKACIEALVLRRALAGTPSEEAEPAERPRVRL